VLTAAQIEEKRMGRLPAHKKGKKAKDKHKHKAVTPEDPFHLTATGITHPGVNSRTNQSCVEVRLFCRNNINFCQENAGSYATHIGFQIYDFVYPLVDLAVHTGVSPGIIWWRFDILPAVKELLQAAFPHTRIAAGLGFPQPDGCNANQRTVVHQRPVKFEKTRDGASTWPLQGQISANALRMSVFHHCKLQPVLAPTGTNNNNHHNDKQAIAGTNCFAHLIILLVLQAPHSKHSKHSKHCGPI
jgi:hypothetical protein